MFYYPANAPPRFHTLVKPTGATCNLDCAYCFFLSKEMLYPGSRFRMADELLELYIRQLIEAHQTKEVSLAFQGGEPTLMGLPFFRRAVEHAERYRRPGMTIEYSMQTNGTLLDDEWGQFLAANRFLIGISIDGPREIHDIYRYDKGGGPTFDRVMRGLDVLKRHKVDWNVLCTLHRNNADRPLDIYRFFRDELGAEFMQFIPIVERVTGEQLPLADTPGEPWRSWRDRPLYTQAGEQVTARSVTGQQYGRFLSAIFDEWVRRDVGRVYVQMFDVALANWIGAPASGLCIHSRTCGTALAIEHNGDLYSCDHFVEPAYLLGNIKQEHLIELVASDQQQKFGRDKYDTLPRYCRDCDVRFACHGGCPKDRFINTTDGEPGLNYLCEGYKIFFHHIDEAMQFMSDELRHERPPANIMAYMARKDAAERQTFAQVSRNAPCPCGSGKKYKHCHGRAGGRA